MGTTVAPNPLKVERKDRGLDPCLNGREKHHGQES